MPKEITFYVILGEKRDQSEICANPNLRNQTHITKKPSYVYVFHLYAQRNHSLRHCPYAEEEDQSFRTFRTSDLFFLLISGLLIGRNEAKKTSDLKNFGPFFMKLPKLQEKCLAHTMVNH